MSVESVARVTRDCFAALSAGWFLFVQVNSWWRNRRTRPKLVSAPSPLKGETLSDQIDNGAAALGHIQDRARGK